MKVRRLVTDLVLSAAAGYLGTKAMEPVSMKLYQLKPAQARAREDAVRPGPPYRLAAEKLTKVLGLELNENQLNRLSLVFTTDWRSSGPRCTRCCAVAQVSPPSPPDWPQAPP